MKRFISMLLALVGCLVLGGAQGESRVVDAALVVEGYSFGPGVSKILLNLNEPVQSVELLDGAVVTAGVERQIVDVYPCDARAERTDQASAQIAVELSQEELRASTPFAQGELSALSVWAPSYTDMRKQIDGLAALVQTQFGQEMDETSLYLFCGRRADRIKALYWDGTGYILLYKRLTEKRFQWPRSEKDLKKLTLQEFRWLMEGLSITQTKAFVPGKPGAVC